MNHKYLTTKQVSEMLNISVSTVKRYSEYGYIKYIRLQNSKHRRYIKSSIDKYLLDQNNLASIKLDNNEKVKIGKLVANPHPKHYLMHKYWGRKPHNIINKYVKFFTKIGDIVLDPFMGSGVTVLESLKLNRKAVGIDLNPMSVSIVENTISNVNLNLYKKYFDKIYNNVYSSHSNIYSTNCPLCNKISKIDCSVWDKDRIVSVRGSCDTHGKFIKLPSKYDIDLYEKCINSYKTLPRYLKNLIPKDTIPRYVRRSGKDRIVDLFSERSLIILSLIKHEINLIKNREIQNLLNFTFTSMLSNASKMLPGDKDKATYKSGWVISKFWVPTVHAERNVLECFKLRFKAIFKGKAEVPVLDKKNYKIIKSDSTKISLNDNSIDYIFTDPPYGESIAYFSLSHIWNSWLGKKPNFKSEIIIDNNRKKGYEDYSKRIKKCYSEMFRVLKPGGYMSFTFHNRDLNVWKAIIDACNFSGFEFQSAVLQQQAVSSGTQGINKENTLKGDFVYTYLKPTKKNKNRDISYHPDGETLIVNEVHNFLSKNGVTNSSDLYEYIIPIIIKNNAILNSSGKVIRLEKLLLQNFKFEKINSVYKWDILNRDKSSINLNVLDLFAGAGGMSSGFSKAGFKIIAAIENDKRIKDTYMFNHPETKLIVEDIRNISAGNDKNSTIDIADIFKSLDKKCDVIIGGPPCQGFSMSGNRIRKSYNFFDDKRNLLFLEYFRIVKSLKPKIFIIENVPGILNFDSGNISNQIKEKFVSIGYDVSCRVLCAADYGVPQLRKRAFFIGNNLDLNSDDLFPEPTHNKKNYVSVDEAISDLPSVKPGESINPFSKKDYTIKNSKFQKSMRSKNDFIFNHSSSKPTEKTIKILKLIKQGKGLKDLPKKYQTKSVHSGAYGRINPNKPSYTLTTRLNTPSVGRITHPTEHRTITPREAARLQTFDDSYRFFGNITSIGIQIGNAVPPLLAYKLAMKIIEKLKKLNGKI